MKIYEYVGPKNNQGIDYGTPFLVIGFCDGEWELSRTTWYDVNNDHPKVIDLYNNLQVNLSVIPFHFEKYFRFFTEIKS